MSSLLSKFTIGTIGLTCKTFLNIGYCGSVTVNGLDNLINALKSEERNNGRGVITLSNHISTLDDPVTWGILPTRYFFSTRTTRWVLGASDIMFTNPLLSTFFRNGQVIETFRGGGIFQQAVDIAIRKVNEGAWVHLFGEGKVNQPLLQSSNRGDSEQHAHQLLRFKWGVGRIVMEARVPPVIIPMWLTGFDQLMPEGRPGIRKFFPRPGVHLSVTFGKPIDDEAIRRALKDTVSTHKHDVFSSRSSSSSDAGEQKGAAKSEEGWLRDAIPSTKSENASGKQDEQAHSVEATSRTRSALTALIQSYVQALGDDVIRQQRTP
ncbi:acyltransferase-domain-containing protein [Panus rudis PR-1116 ss-1]|nr:acyltransferase-domain-containing protein [Panus rudis PR-1116 ss-1]